MPYFKRQIGSSKYIKPPPERAGGRLTAPTMPREATHSPSHMAPLWLAPYYCRGFVGHLPHVSFLAEQLAPVLFIRLALKATPIGEDTLSPSRKPHKNG